MVRRRAAMINGKMKTMKNVSKGRLRITVFSASIVKLVFDIKQLTYHP